MIYILHDAIFIVNRFYSFSLTFDNVMSNSVQFHPCILHDAIFIVNRFISFL